MGVKNNKTFVQDTQERVSIASPTPAPDPTADWISYVNDKDGYSIKYPTDWGSEKCPPGGTDNQIIYICSSEKFGNAIEPVSYYIWISKVTQLDNQWAYKQDSISGLAAFRTIDIPSRSGAESVFFKANDNSYISISFTPYDLQNPFTQQDRFYKTFNQILSTFKFTDSEAIVSPSPTPTPLSAYHIIQGSSLNTYTNNVYSFSFNFPKSLFLYNSQSNSEYAGFLQKQGNINALRMYVDVFKNPNDLSLEEVEAKYNLKKNQGNEYALENTTINGKDAIIVAGNKSMRELCNYNDDQKRRVVVAALVKGSKYVLVFNTNNTCETFQEDWVSDIVNSVKL